MFSNNKDELSPAQFTAVIVAVYGVLYARVTFQTDELTELIIEWDSGAGEMVII